MFCQTGQSILIIQKTVFSEIEEAVYLVKKVIFDFRRQLEYGRSISYK